MIRLPFALPPFSRVTWASAAIRAKWDERVARVRRALDEGERPSRWGGIFPARIVKIYPYREREWAAEARGLGLDVERREASESELTLDEDLSSGKAMLLLAGRPDAVKQARGERFGRVFGAPPCCVREAERMRSLGLRCEEMILMISSAPDATPDRPASLPQAWETNLFWRGAGVGLLPYTPCSVGCEPTKAPARELLARMKRGGLDEEAEWLREMLSWSLSWSALHGVAELKTPLFKASSATDATAQRHEIRLEGTSPNEAPSGVGFPYQTQKRRRNRPAAANAEVANACD